jgi:hypothetical protein
MGLIRTILIILLIFFAVRFVMRLLLPFIMAMFFKKVERKIREQQDNAANSFGQESFEKHGDVYIKRPSGKNKDTKSDDGEFVDYKEVD